MTTKNAEQSTTNGNEILPILYWVLGSIWAPITLPWIIYQMLGTLHMKYKRTNLNSKVVLITGASSGLGEALAHAFYAAGCRVILAARRKNELERVKKDLLESHQTVPTHVPIILPLDLTDLPSLPKNIETVLGICSQIDILINNGGITSRGNVLNTDLGVYEKLMLVNYFGQVCLTKAVLPSMVERKSGHIVLISSVQGLIGIPNRSAYAASKHAIQAFCDSLRAEVAEHNVEVTVVSPGYIKTELSLNALTESGSKYGRMDENTAKGYSAEYVAEQIVRAVVEKKNEVIIAPPTARIAVYLRRLLPSVYFWIMNKRAKNEV